MPTIAAHEFFLGKTYDIEFQPALTVKELHKAVAKAAAEPVANVRLFHNGFELEAKDGTTCGELGMEANETQVHVLYHPRTNKLSWGDAVGADGELDLDVIFKHFEHEGAISDSFAKKLVKKATRHFQAQPTMIEVAGPITVVGDIHGQFFDLRNIFEAGGALGDRKYLFLGDYVDRGYFSTETVLFLLAAVLRYPDKVFMLRGNHESASQAAKASGSGSEITRKLSQKMLDSLINMYQSMSPCALLESTPGSSHKFFCCHGGIAKAFPKVSKLATFDRTPEDERIAKGKLKEIMWNDPAPDHDFSDDDEAHPKGSDAKWRLDKVVDDDASDSASGGSSKRDWAKSKRGRNIYTFSLAATKAFLARNNIRGIIRGHQQKPGYSVSKPGPFGIPAVITVFSAPNYVDQSLAMGGVAKFDKGNKLSLKEYTWSFHPVYHNGAHLTKPFEKNYVMEAFLVYLSHFHPKILKTVSLVHLRSTIEARKFIAVMRARGHDVTLADLQEATSDWDYLKANLLEVLSHSKSPSVRAFRRDKLKRKTGSNWAKGFDHLAYSILAEAQNEVEEITYDV